MKRLVTILTLVLTCCLGAFAQQQADALRLTLKAANAEPVELLFTSKPTITYTADHKSMTLHSEGKESLTVLIADVENMTFFFSDGKLENIEKAFADPTEPAHRGTYTLDGKRVEAITAPGTYIINGKKVSVK